LPIDPYVLESPAEFFAVASEQFFEGPATLRLHLPDVYRERTQFAGNIRTEQDWSQSLRLLQIPGYGKTRSGLVVADLWLKTERDTAPWYDDVRRQAGTWKKNAPVVPGRFLVSG